MPTVIDFADNGWRAKSMALAYTIALTVLLRWRCGRKGNGRCTICSNQTALWYALSVSATLAQICSAIRLRVVVVQLAQLHFLTEAPPRPPHQLTQLLPRRRQGRRAAPGLLQLRPTVQSQRQRISVLADLAAVLVRPCKQSLV